jgi:hypothetical protein
VDIIATGQVLPAGPPVTHTLAITLTVTP